MLLFILLTASVLTFSTPNVTIHHHVMNFFIYIFVDIHHFVLQLGEWSAAVHGHPPGLVSATEYIGNHIHIKCPTFCLTITYHIHIISHVDSYHFIIFPIIAPND